MSTPRDAPEPVTSADFFSLPPGLMSAAEAEALLLGSAGSAGFAVPPASPAEPASTVAISVTGLAVYEMLAL